MAILSNPRLLSASGGGSGMTVLIDIHDNQVRSEGDLDQIARKVLEQLGRRAAEVGLRSIG